MWFIRLEISEMFTRDREELGSDVIRQICIHIGLLFYLQADVLKVQRKIIPESQ